MNRFVIFILTILMLACYINKNHSGNKKYMQKITISGIAHNSKSGAIVVTKENMYYLEGLDNWHDSILNKTIEVKGFCRSDTLSTDNLKDKNNAYYQGNSGIKNTILKPVWKIIK
jgi:hypothetical protein